MQPTEYSDLVVKCWTPNLEALSLNSAGAPWYVKEQVSETHKLPIVLINTHEVVAPSQHDEIHYCSVESQTTKK